MLFPTLRSSSLPVVVAQPDERNANRTVSVLESGMTDTEHSTISGSNEEVVVVVYCTLGFPKLCAMKETRLHHKNLIFWQKPFSIV